MTQVATSRVDGAYTVIELLVVIAIILVLAALVVTVLNGKPVEIKRTEVIIRTVNVALATAGAQGGSTISPTEHPFAGSQAEAGGQRFAFVRSDPAWPGSVATSGTALRGVPNPGYLDADAGHLLMASDRYADRRIILLYGARRCDIGILQSQRKVVTKYRQLPLPPETSNGTQAKVLSPRTGQRTPGGYQGDNHPDYPDTLVPSISQQADSSYGRLSDSKSALDYLFGASSAKSELASLKALFNADPSLPEDVNDFRIPVETRSVGTLSEGLVYTNYGTDAG
ncbi:MAG TPA: type II secretion system protein, partial [Planctomycetota bacterium]|nr:type II secretion system protein [Planctomycetota bacterium]